MAIPLPTPTNNPVPSADIRDHMFAGAKLDEAVTSKNFTYTDRFGQQHLTIDGIKHRADQAISAFGYITMDSFQAGATLTLPNQVLRDTSTGEYYRWDGAFPKVVPAGATPATAGGVAKGAWVSVGDASLRANLGSSETGMGAGLVNTDDGLTVQEHLDNIKNKFGSVMPEDFGLSTDTANLLAAVAYAKTNGINVNLKTGKTYTLTGTRGLEIDLGKFSFGPLFGHAKIDASGFTGAYAVWVHSSLPYPDAMYLNTPHEFRGVVLIGDRTISGVAGLLLGNNDNDTTNGTYNGQCNIIGCTFSDFDTVILCTNSTWRYKFTRCTVSSGTSRVFYAPAGLTNSGENISFDNSWIADSKNAPFEIGCENFAVMMVNTSVVNTRILVSGTAAHFFFSLGNIENPGATAFYKYVEITGTHAEAVISNSSVAMNQPSLFTDAPYSGVANSTFKFLNVKTQSNAYVPQTTTGIRVWVSGDCFVMASGCSFDYTSGGVKIPFAKRLGIVCDSDFESGGLTHWIINNASQVTQTAQVIAGAARNGSYGLQLTSISGYSIYATQKVAVSPGRAFVTSAWGKVVTSAASGNPGTISIDFYDYGGVQISGSSYSSNMSNSNTDWTVLGGFLCGIVPAGAAYAQLNLRAYNGGVVYYDDIVINLI
nr:hypothetical protein [Pantoea cypripedii]